MIADFHFLRPLWLLALLAAPLLVMLIGRRTDVRSQWQGMIAPHLLDHLLIEKGGRRRLQPVHLTAVYKGGAPALADLVGGHIDLMFDTPSTAVPYIHAGKIRALGVTGEKRLPGIPDVPTIAEAAVPGFNFFTWAGIATPSGVPEPVIKKLEAILQKVVASPETRQQLLAIDLEPVGGTSKEFQELVRRESAIDRKSVV